VEINSATEVLMEITPSSFSNVATHPQKKQRVQNIDVVVIGGYIAVVQGENIDPIL